MFSPALLSPIYHHYTLLPQTFLPQKGKLIGKENRIKNAKINFVFRFFFFFKSLKEAQRAEIQEKQEQLEQLEETLQTSLHLVQSLKNENSASVSILLRSTTQGRPWDVLWIQFAGNAVGKDRLSLRQIPKVVKTFSDCFGLNLKEIPSHSSITNFIFRHSKIVKASIAQSISQAEKDSIEISVDGTSTHNRHFEAITFSWKIGDEFKSAILQVVEVSQSDAIHSAARVFAVLQEIQEIQREIEIEPSDLKNFHKLVCDNANVNKKMAELLTDLLGVRVSFQGCSDHISNLVCNHLVEFLISQFPDIKLLKTISKRIAHEWKAAFGAFQHQNGTNVADIILTSNSIKENRYVSWTTNLDFFAKNQSLVLSFLQSLDSDKFSDHLNSAIDYFGSMEARIICALFSCFNEIFLEIMKCAGKNAEEYSTVLQRNFAFIWKWEKQPELFFTFRDFGIKCDGIIGEDLAKLTISKFSSLFQKLFCKHDWKHVATEDDVCSERNVFLRVTSRSAERALAEAISFLESGSFNQNSWLINSFCIINSWKRVEWKEFCEPIQKKWQTLCPDEEKKKIAFLLDSGYVKLGKIQKENVEQEIAIEMEKETKSSQKFVIEVFADEIEKRQKKKKKGHKNNNQHSEEKAADNDVKEAVNEYNLQLVKKDPNALTLPTKSKRQRLAACIKIHNLKEREKENFAAVE